MKITLYGLMLSAAFFAAACGNSAPPTANNSNANANNKPVAPTNLKTPFDDALFNVRNGDFEQVLVFTRKDDAPMKPDDFDFLKANSPNEGNIAVNRWLKADDKTVVAGTNYLFTPEHLNKLQPRYRIRDFSLSNDGTDFDAAKYQADYQSKIEQMKIEQMKIEQNAANSNTKK